MKKLHFITIVMFSALCLISYAQAGEKGSGMMGGQGSQHQMNDGGMMGQGKEMMMQQHQGEMGQMQMMQGKEMHQKMSPCMDRMQNMMQNMNQMMGKDVNNEGRAKMADVMKDMSKHMMDMSTMMKNGHCTLKEIDKLDKDTSDTQKRFEELENYL